MLIVSGLATLARVPEARAAAFDARGVLTPDPGAVASDSFDTLDVGDAGASSGSIHEGTALEGDHYATLELRDEGVRVALTLPSGTGSYRARVWLRGDATAGVAVDYGAGRPGTVSRAFPTGRVTSDGWVELETQPFNVDGGASGLDARMFFAAYDANTPTDVDVDALEVVPDGAYVAPAACSGLDAAHACRAGELCVEGACRDARGWFPPLPAASERAALSSYWHQKLSDSFGVYELRKTTLPTALAAIDAMATAADGVTFWGKLAEAIRVLRDAHTYARVGAVDGARLTRPMNLCFVEGEADASQSAAPSDATLPDLLVSHVGTGQTWDLAAGDRLVSVDGQHPLTWAKTLMGPSLWYWEADDPEQRANVAVLLRDLIPRHATTLGVVRCTGGSCGAVTQIDVLAQAPVADPAGVTLVGCDNRPVAHLTGIPADHRYGDGFFEPAKIVEGEVLDATANEMIHGLVWNTLLGGEDQSPVDAALNAAVGAFAGARGVMLDHREGHGGTAPTANILIGFSRTPFVPFVGVVRTRIDDEGPADAAAGQALFQRYSGRDDELGSVDARPEIPVALLTTWDVSASDYLLYGLKGGAKVKLFGPGPSMGAYGTFVQYSIWGLLRWSVGIQDALAPDGTPLCTHGVDPDFLVRPKQSDLMIGKDTLHEAAIGWLRTELVP